jgi:hypothetical protein
MSKSFKMLRQKMSQPAQEAAATKTREMLKVMPLQKLRQAHQMSQERLLLLHPSFLTYYSYNPLIMLVPTGRIERPTY